jgi:DNA-binding transcriptional LysR family regulator
MRIDVQSLEVFLAVAEKLSFTRASEELGVSQPRVSLIVRRLEDQLGFPLFRRVHGRVELTREGEDLRERSRQLMAAVDDFERALEDTRRTATSRLRIGSPNYTTQIPDRVWLFDEFALRHPAVALEFVIDRTPPLVEAVEAGELDIAAVTGPFEHRGLETLFLVKSTSLLAVPRESPLAALDVISAGDVQGCAIATYPADVGPLYLQRWYGPLKAAGAVLVASKEAKAEAVLRFAARRRLPTTVQIWPGQNLPPASAAPDMVYRPLAGMDLSLELHLVRRPGHHSPPSNWLWRLAGTYFRDGRTPTLDGVELGLAQA